LWTKAGEGMGVHTGQRQEGGKFEAHLEYSARPCLKQRWESWRKNLRSIKRSSTGRKYDLEIWIYPRNEEHRK
jgi:hypothetical protein